MNKTEILDGNTPHPTSGGLPTPPVIIITGSNKKLSRNAQSPVTATEVNQAQQSHQSREDRFRRVITEKLVAIFESALKECLDDIKSKYYGGE